MFGETTGEGRRGEGEKGKQETEIKTAIIRSYNHSRYFKGFEKQCRVLQSLARVILLPKK